MPAPEAPKQTCRMPAEWEPHEAVWLQWPDSGMRGTPAFARRLLTSWLEMAAILADHVTVRIAATSEAAAADIARDCARFGVNMKRVEIMVIPIDDVWARDTGPVFVKDAAGKLAVTDWNFNGWGDGGAIEKDRLVPGAIAKLYGLERLVGGITTEGGALEVNGTGTLLATRSSILNPNRNPGKSQGDAEATLAELLGITNFIWLSGAPPDICYSLGDVTDFHIDLVARFVGRNTVLASHTDDVGDPRKPYIDRHMAELKAAADETGKPLDVIALPTPRMLSISPVTFSGGHPSAGPGSHTDASYANYLVTNGLVLVPAYGQPEDARAMAIIAEHFPGREVIGMSAISLTEQGGAIHCVTQQQPAGRPIGSIF